MKSKTNWRGFLANCWDTKIMSSYVDENFSNGLKQNSKRYLNYEQETYAQVTTMTGMADDLPKGGRILSEAINEDGVTIVTKQYRMNELTARHVLGYGADDTICTSALFNFYEIQMELENTIGVYEEVEIKPAYLTAKGYVDGCKVSIERMRELEREDDKVFEDARTILAKTMLDNGLLDKMWEPMEELTCATARAAFEELYGYKIESKVRMLSKLATQIRSNPDLQEGVEAHEFAAALDRNDLGYIQGLMLAKYKSNPVIDMGSTKQMRKFLYDVLKLPVRVVTKVTAIERVNNKPLANAIYKYTKAAMKGEDANLNDEEKALLRQKAKTDDTAVDMAILLDADGVAKTILKSMQAMKTVMTRRSLYYNKYPYQKHWKDGLIHSSMNQCAAVTRRYSSSGPNLQQLPKKGEGIRLREMIIPHHKNAVIVSLDFSGQELRLCAEQSQDANMLACYIGDKLKDIHSITAAGAMNHKWGKAKVEELISTVGFQNMGSPEDAYDLFVMLHKVVEDKDIHKLADDLRKNAKNVNFGAQYDSQALTLSYQLLMPVADAQAFLDAREKMFPGVTVWKDKVRDRVNACGYASTMMGARRHLGRLLMDRATANKAGRQGPNFEIQSSAAEMSKLAMGRVWDSGVLYDYDCRFIAPIHDEFVLSIDREDTLPAIKIVHSCMVGQYANMKVPVLSSISLGPNFGIQYETGDWYIEDRIKAALDKVFNKEAVPA